SWGTALAIVLANNGQKVRLWDRDLPLMEDIHKTGKNNRYLPNIILPKNIKSCLTLADALQETNHCLIVVPSHGFKELLRAMKPLIASNYRIIWATKGLCSENGDFLHERIQQELGNDRAYAVLSGPSFAKEVALGLPTA